MRHIEADRWDFYVPLNYEGNVTCKSKKDGSFVSIPIEDLEKVIAAKVRHIRVNALEDADDRDILFGSCAP